MTSQKQDWERDFRDKFGYLSEYVLHHLDSGDYVAKDNRDEYTKIIEQIKIIVSLSVSQARKQERERIREMLIEKPGEAGWSRKFNEGLLEALSPKEEDK